MFKDKLGASNYHHRYLSVNFQQDEESEKKKQLEGDTRKKRGREVDRAGLEEMKMKRKTKKVKTKIEKIRKRD